MWVGVLEFTLLDKLLSSSTLIANKTPRGIFKWLGNRLQKTPDAGEGTADLQWTHKGPQPGSLLTSLAQSQSRVQMQ